MSRRTPTASSEAPILTKVRINSSSDQAVQKLVALIGEGFHILEQSAPYPNRRESGVRVYLSVIPKETDA